MLMKGYSKALYSSWYYYAPDRVLFDCGEGASLYLRQEIFAVEKIFISHGHIDHMAGLLTFICLRQSTKGDNDKPLTIYYPEGDRSMGIIRKTIQEMLGRHVKYKLEWVTVNPGMTIELKKGRYMEIFKADHQIENPLTFVVTESRKKLKVDLQGRPGKELAQMSDEEKYDYSPAKLFAFSGDSMPLHPDVYRNVNTLLHECTFLDPADRKYPVHSNVQEVFDLARDASVKRLLLTHISPRYFRKDIPGLLEKVETHGIDYDVVIPERVCRFD
jgi:ribonuclease Z